MRVVSMLIPASRLVLAVALTVTYSAHAGNYDWVGITRGGRLAYARSGT